MDTLPSSLTPLCFNRHEFTKPSFSVDGFLARSRSHASLQQLKSDLHIYLKIIQNAMIELINKDYADFVNLSSNLVNLKLNVTKLERNLSEVSEELETYAGRLIEVIDGLTAQIDALRDATTEQDNVEKHIQALLAITKLKALLKADTDTQTDSQTTPTKTLGVERLKRYIAQLEMVSTAIESPTLGPKMSLGCRRSYDRSSKCLVKLLDATFLHAVQSRNENLLAAALRTYVAARCLESAQALFMCEYIEPRLTASLQPSDSTAKGRRDSARQLGLILSGLAAIWTEYRDLFRSNSPTNTSVLRVERPNAQSTSSSLMSPAAHGGTSFLLDSLLSALLAVIEERFPEASVPTDAAVFHACFAPLLRWPESFSIDAGESSASLCSLSRIVSAHSTYRRVLAQFGVSVYYQLVAQDVRDRMEGSIQSVTKQTKAGASNILETPMTVQVALPNTQRDRSDGTPNPPKELKLYFDPASALIRLSLEIWDPNDGAYLPPLRSSLWKLQASLVNRYSGWVRRHAAVHISTLLKSMGKSRSGTPFQQQQPKIQNVINGDVGTVGPDGKREASPVNPLNRAMGVDPNPMEMLIALVVDLRVITSFLNWHLRRTIAAVSPTEQSFSDEADSDELAKALRSTCEKSCESLSEVSERIRVAVTTHLTAAMTTALSGVSEIPRQYRWTRKERPSAPSVYVKNGITPLLAFVTLVRASKVPTTPMSSPQKMASPTRASPGRTSESGDLPLEALHHDFPAHITIAVLENTLHAVINNYRDGIKDVMVSVDKMSSSLSKLKRSATRPHDVGKDTGGTGSTSQNDDEKIRLQLGMDVAEFRRAIKEDIDLPAPMKPDLDPELNKLDSVLLQA